MSKQFDREELERWIARMAEYERENPNGHEIDMRAPRYARALQLALRVVDAAYRVGTHPDCADWCCICESSSHDRDCPVRACQEAGLTRG